MSKFYIRDVEQTQDQIARLTKTELFDINIHCMRKSLFKYFPNTKKPPTKRQIQSWKTFIKNHMNVTWATDFFTVPTLKFDILYF